MDEEHDSGDSEPLGDILNCFQYFRGAAAYVPQKV